MGYAFVSYSGVEGECDMLVVAGGGEGDLRKSEIILSAGQRGVQHQHIALETNEDRDHPESHMKSSSNSATQSHTMFLLRPKITSKYLSISVQRREVEKEGLS